MCRWWLVWKLGSGNVWSCLKPVCVTKNIWVEEHKCGNACAREWWHVCDSGHMGEGEYVGLFVRAHGCRNVWVCVRENMCNWKYITYVCVRSSMWEFMKMCVWARQACEDMYTDFDESNKGHWYMSVVMKDWSCLLHVPESCINRPSQNPITWPCFPLVFSGGKICPDTVHPISLPSLPSRGLLLRKIHWPHPISSPIWSQGHKRKWGPQAGLSG